MWLSEKIKTSYCMIRILFLQQLVVFLPDKATKTKQVELCVCYKVLNQS